MPTMRPEDRSAPAVRMAKAAPMATMTRVEFWIITLRRVSRVRKAPSPCTCA